jgi:DNA polymerase-3 subunit delta
MRVAYGKLVQHIKENPSPVYLLSGEEGFLKEELLKQIISAIPLEPVSFNYDVFYGGENSGAEIVSRALTFPFGPSRRLIVVKSAKLLTEEDKEKLLSYLESPSENTLLILAADMKSTQTGFFGKAARLGVEIDFKTMYDNEIMPWLRKRADSMGKCLSFRAAYELKEHAGTNLRQLTNELEKLSVQVGGRKEIEVEDVRLSVGESRIRTGFELADAIGNKKEAAALSVLSSLIEQGKSAPEIIGLLAWQFRRIWGTKIRMETGLGHGEIAKALKIPGFAVRGLVAQARKFSHIKLEESFSLLLKTDVGTKSGEIRSLSLELLVIRLCRD